MSRPRWMAVSIHPYPGATGAVEVFDIIGPRKPFCVIREADEATACAAVLASGLVPKGMRPIADTMAEFLKRAGCRTIKKYLSLPRSDRQPTLAELQAAAEEEGSDEAGIPDRPASSAASVTIDLAEDLHQRFTDALARCGMTAEGVLARDILCFCERAESAYANSSLRYGVMDADALFLVLWTFERAERLATSVPPAQLITILDGELERLGHLREHARQGRQYELTPVEES